MRERRRRWLMFGLGWIFFALGALGTVLPILPTTPFMLLALWAFSSSSQRFHDWLFHHPVFGPPLQRWKVDRVIPLWAKVVAISSMAASLLYMGLVSRPPWYAVAGMAAVIVAGLAYILRFPSKPPPERR